MATKISYAKAAAVLTDYEQQFVALDCEMVMASVGGAEPVHSLAQIAIVDWNGKRILNTYVKPEGVITDYLEEYSGIKPEHLAKAPSFADVRRQVIEIITGKIVVGHGLDSDFKALKIKYNPLFARDTAAANMYRQNVRNGRTGEMIRGARRLKNLTNTYLEEKIQVGAHDPEIDARAAMLLYQKNQMPIDFERMITYQEYAYVPQIIDLVAPVAAPVKRPLTMLSVNAPAFVPGNKTGKARKSRKQRKTRKQRK